MRSRRGSPWASIARTEATIIASMSFMSTAPRPHSSPSLMTPSKGSTLQSSAAAGTTSVWPWTTRAGACGSEPLTRATRLARPGEDSTISDFRSTSASQEAMSSAAGSSGWLCSRPSSGVDADEPTAQFGDFVLCGTEIKHGDSLGGGWITRQCCDRPDSHHRIPRAGVASLGMGYFRGSKFTRVILIGANDRLNLQPCKPECEDGLEIGGHLLVVREGGLEPHAR